MKKLLLTILVLLSFSSATYASHVMGADITYTCLGGDQYQINLTIYRDCAGIDLDTSIPQSVNFTSSCGTFDFDLDWVSMTDVSQVCPTQTTTCNGGTIPGTEQYLFSGIVTLPPCADWNMNWDLCCRNDGITNLVDPGLEDLYIQTTLNNVLAPCNNSPQFLALPTPYLCPNQLSIYNHGASDIDGDSLYYQFNTPLSGTTAPGTPIAFSGGYTQNDPIQTTAGMNLNPETGEMCFTPSNTQICVVSVIVYEYRNNVLIGTQIREMQVVVSNTCSNTAPFAGAAPSCGNVGGMVITQAGPSVIQTDSNSISMCPLDSVCFEINFLDPDGNNVTVSSNAATAIPGATFNVINNGTTNPIGQFCWYPSPLDSGINVLTVNLLDDACPISASQYYTYDITVFDQPYAGPDQIICGPQWAQLSASGGAGYTWSVLSGDPLNPGVNITCNPCYNPQVKPSVTTTYLLTSSLSASCINTDTVTVTVVPDFTIIPYGDTVLCDYLSTPIGIDVLPAVGTYTIDWDNVATLNDNTILNPDASPLSTTTYAATITSPFGCVKTDSVIVGVNPPPTLTLTPGDTSICLGGSLNFDVQSTCTYTLEMFDSFGDGWNDQAISVYDNGVLVGTYTVLGTDNNGDWNTVTFPITNGNTITLVYTTGAFQSESSFNLIDGLGSLQYSVPQGGMSGWIDGATVYTGTGSCGPTLANYSFNWTPATGLSATNIQNPIATPVVNTTYTVTLSDTNGCSVNRDQTITVVPNYSLVTTQSDTMVCLGETVNFTATTNPTGTYNYVWSPGNIMSDSTSATPTSTFTTPGLNTIIVNADNGGGCVKSDTLFVNVSSVYAPNISIINNDTTIGCTDSVSINLDLGLSPTCDYTLEMFDSFGDGWNDQTISIYDNGVLVGTYTVLDTDNNGDWNTVTFPISNGGTITIVYGTGSWQSESSFNLIDGEGNLQFAVAQGDMSGWVDGSTVYTGIGNCGPALTNYIYSWSPTAGVSDPLIENPVLTPSTTTTYYVTVSDSSGNCSDVDSILVTVTSQVTGSTSTIPATCNGSNDGQIIATGNGPNPPFTIEFFDSTGALLQSNVVTSSDTLNGISSGTYTVTITDVLSCSFDTTITLVPTTGVDLVSISPDDLICIDGSSTISAQGSGGTGTVSLIWDNGLVGDGPHTVNPSVNTTYTVFAQDAMGCMSNPQSVTISIRDSIQLSALILGRDSICPEDTTSISIPLATGGSGVGYTYEWYDSNNNLVGTGLNVVVEPTADTETYTIVVGDNCTTPTVSENITVYWSPLPQPSFVAINTSGCYPITTSFINTTPNSSNINSVLWNFGDNQTSNNIIDVDHQYNYGSCFDVTLTVTSIVGCVRDTTVQDMVCAYDYPIADFSMTPQPTDITNPFISFSNESFDNADNYWSFTGGNPLSSSEVNPNVEFPSDTPGTYLVELAVVNNNGCTDTTYREVIIDGLYLFYIPNSFTPNGDRLNDYFRPQGDGVDWSKYHFMIFDRWGEKLFETDDVEQGWDGTYKGKLVPTGIYVWKITAKELYRDVNTEHSGHVNLLR